MLGAVLLFAVTVVQADQALTEVANEIAEEANLPYHAVVFIHEPWRAEGVVNAETNRKENLIVIAVSPLLAEDLDADAVRAMLAHEIAHYQNSCGPKYASLAEAIACEKRADARSVTWVGKRAVLRGLCQLIASSWRWRYVTDVSDLIERIAYIHQLPEGPP